MLGAWRAARAGLLLVGLLLVACQAILGDFEIVPAPGETCEDGRFRCNGAFLFCVGSNEELTLLSPCSSDTACDPVEGRCKACEAGKFRCVEAKLEVCAADASAWEAVATCATADECNVSAGECRACTPGEKQCAGANFDEFRECTANHTWGETVTCATQELCEASVAAAIADPARLHECVPPACPTPEAYECGPNLELLRCLESQTEWSKVDDCLSIELCLASVSDPAATNLRGGQCLDPVCYPAGTRRCNGTALEACHPDLLGWGLVEDCVAPYECNTNRGCAGPCEPGEHQCNDSTLETCTDQQVWEVTEQCANPTLCSAETGECLAVTCPTPLAYRCNGLTLEQCLPDQTAWNPVAACPSEALCIADGARCDPALCETAGAVRCNPAERQELQICRDDLTGWDLVATCSSTQSCNPVPEGPACIDQCPEPSVICNGARREVCSGDTGVPVWTTTATCPTSDLCECGLDRSCANGYSQVDGFCGVPLCGGSLASTNCMNDDLFTCQAGRNGWDFADDCAPYPCVTNSGAHHCGECNAGDTQCTSTGLRTCNAQTRLWNNPTSCGSFPCNTEGADHCGVCNVGDAECVNGALRTCDATTRLWTSASACSPFACVTVPGADYCGVCNVGDAECVNGALRTCDATTRLWTSASACSPFACVTVPGTDYCGVCNVGDAECVSGGLRTCDATTRQWSAPISCDPACMPATGPDYCAECSPGEARCVSGGLETCNATTRLWDDPAPCEIGCKQSTVGPSYCVECLSTDAECVSGGLRTCDSLTQRWGTAVPCAGPCFTVTAGPDYCADCEPGVSECVTDTDRRVCNQQGQWDAAELCSIACLGTSPETYCAECDDNDDCVLLNCVLGLCEDP